jgi:hypothetical protein
LRPSYSSTRTDDGHPGSGDTRCLGRAERRRDDRLRYAPLSLVKNRQTKADAL